MAWLPEVIINGTILVPTINGTMLSNDMSQSFLNHRMSLVKVEPEVPVNMLDHMAHIVMSASFHLN